MLGSRFRYRTTTTPHRSPKILSHIFYFRLKLVSAWKGTLPGDSHEEDSDLYKSKAFKMWVNRHKIGSAEAFHLIANGTLIKKPYFPLEPPK